MSGGSAATFSSASLPEDAVVDGFQEALHVDGLALVAVEAGVEDVLAVLGHGRGRDRHDPHGPRGRVFTQPLEGGDAVDPRQLNVHQHESGLAGAGQLDPLFARLRLDGFVSLELKHVAHEPSILFVVLDDQDELTRHGRSPEA